MQAQVQGWKCNLANEWFSMDHVWIVNGPPIPLRTIKNWQFSHLIFQIQQKCSGLWVGWIKFGIHNKWIIIKNCLIKISSIAYRRNSWGSCWGRGWCSGLRLGSHSKGTKKNEANQRRQREKMMFSKNRGGIPTIPTCKLPCPSSCNNKSKMNQISFIVRDVKIKLPP